MMMTPVSERTSKNPSHVQVQAKINTPAEEAITRKMEKDEEATQGEEHEDDELFHDRGTK